MTHVTDKGFVDIQAVSENPPPNPLLGYKGSAPPIVTRTKLNSKSQRDILTHQVLLYDQRCLVTGGVSDQLRAFCLINTIRTHGSKSQKDDLKKQVESILTRQQFGIGHFYLDSLPNCISLEPQFQGTLHTYGSFCITVPLEQIHRIIESLCGSNSEWQYRAASNPQATRNLNLQADPFVVKKCVLLVLRRDLFLPENRALLINTHRVLRDPGGPLPMSGATWTQYRLQDNSPYLVNPASQPYTEFSYESKRHSSQGLSIFSLLVNAHSKLQAMKRRSDASPDASVYATFIEMVIDLIFFVPIDGTREEHIEKDTEVELDPDHCDIDSEEDSEVEDPDLINGLTFPEMEAVLQQVSDGTILGEARAEAAMLMLGMAPGQVHRRHALSPLIKDNSSNLHSRKS